jgi:hypothetical protein
VDPGYVTETRYDLAYWGPERPLLVKNCGHENKQRNQNEHKGKQNDKKHTNKTTTKQTKQQATRRTKPNKQQSNNKRALPDRPAKSREWTL